MPFLPRSIQRSFSILHVILKTLIFVTVLVTQKGCQPYEVKTDTSSKILRIGNGSEQRDLDPQTVNGIPETRIILALLEGLVAYHPADDNIPFPGAAESWEVSTDKRTWTFHLRKSGRWSNGDLVTAADFVYSWKRAINPELGCEYADWFYIIEGAREWHTGKLDDFSKVGIKSIDPMTFQVTLKQPIADFLKIILNVSFLPIHPSTIESHGGAGVRSSGWTRPEYFVGNGPFKLVEWVPDSHTLLKRNAYYWDAESVKLDGIAFYPISDENTEMLAFETGQLHITNSLPSSRRHWYLQNRPDEIRFDPYAGVYFYRLNTQRGVLQDIRIRKALSVSINREAITKNILRGGETAAWAYVPNGIGGYKPPRLINYDPDEARRLLAEAGYPGGKSFPPLKLLFNTSENHRRIAEAIQNMWKKELGINISLTNQEWKSYLNTTQNMDYDIARAGWIGNLYPHSFLRIYTSDSVNNETGYANEQFDHLIETIFTTMDQNERNRLVEGAEKMLLAEQPVIPIYWYTNVFLIKGTVLGWNPKLVDLRTYKFIDLAEMEM